MKPLSLSRAEARRIALTAQGFRDPRHATPSLRTVARTIRRTGVLQVDSVNVLQRAHYMPLFSRMGAYDVDLLRRAAEERPRRIVEYWAHVQAYMPVDLWPLMHHRMAHYRDKQGKWWPIVSQRPGLDARVLDVVRERGPLTAKALDAEVATAPRTKEHWGWNWSDSRKILDYLYMIGDVAIAGRTPSFEPIYDIPERVLPEHVLNLPTPSPQEATVELVRRAAISHGVATATCLADYYRMPVQGKPDSSLPGTKDAIAALVDSGDLLPVSVEGWSKSAYLHTDAARPRGVSARALLSPFDPVVWERGRAEALFDFRYRIEIYTPAHLRVHGYYVLPFLLGDRIVGRVDLKAARRHGTLMVQSAWQEDDVPEETAAELATALRELAAWLGLSQIRVAAHGDLAPALAAEVAA